MAAVPYKLLPLSEYQELKDGNSSETLTTTTADFHQNKQHQLNQHAENHEKGSQRTIGEIQKKFVQNIKESQSYPSRIPDDAATTTTTTYYSELPAYRCEKFTAILATNEIATEF